jgi:hypothetical protein
VTLIDPSKKDQGVTIPHPFAHYQPPTFRMIDPTEIVYACSACGATIPEDRMQQHRQWHTTFVAVLTERDARIRELEDLRDVLRARLRSGP